jgi:hypothetical protein
MKFTEGAFRDWRYGLATREYRDRVVTERESWILGNREGTPGISVEENARAIDPGYDMMTPDQQAKVRRDVEAALALWPTHGDGKWKKTLLVRDAIADITLQQVLTRPRDFDVVATPNLNGDYLSDALAAQVGGIGIAPGGNINYVSGHAIFEATHGTAPKYANLDKVNPGSVILSGEMMFRHLGWDEVADLIIKGMENHRGETVTYDFHRLMEGATLTSCSGFAPGDHRPLVTAPGCGTGGTRVALRRPGTLVVLCAERARPTVAISQRTSARLRRGRVLSSVTATASRTVFPGRLRVPTYGDGPERRTMAVAHGVGRTRDFAIRGAGSVLHREGDVARGQEAGRSERQVDGSGPPSVPSAEAPASAAHPAGRFRARPADEIAAEYDSSASAGSASRSRGGPTRDRAARS